MVEGLHHRSLGQRPRTENVTLSLADGHDHRRSVKMNMAFSQRPFSAFRFQGRCPRLRCYMAYGQMRSRLT